MVLACVARVTWLCSVVVDILNDSWVCVRACAGWLSVTLLGKGCARLVIRAVSYVSMCSTCSASGARYAELYCRSSHRC